MLLGGFSSLQTKGPVGLTNLDGTATTPSLEGVKSTTANRPTGWRRLSLSTRMISLLQQSRLKPRPGTQCSRHCRLRLGSGTRGWTVAPTTAMRIRDGRGIFHRGRGRSSRRPEDTAFRYFTSYAVTAAQPCTSRQYESLLVRRYRTREWLCNVLVSWMDPLKPDSCSKHHVFDHVWLKTCMCLATGGGSAPSHPWNTTRGRDEAFY